MSWTIADDNATDLRELEKAVRAAHDAKILMFCSASDQGGNLGSHCYPADFKDCIQIGAASNTGEALTFVNASMVNFLLPGQNIAIYNDEGKSISDAYGSSVATAAASALAGLLIFCSWLLDEKNHYLQERENMCAAFNSMASPSKFLRVQKPFEYLFKEELAAAEKSKHKTNRPPSSYDISTMSWDNECMDALKAVMRYINEKEKG
jgi:Subtilase family